MATVKVYDQNKQESGEMTLASDVFEIEVRPETVSYTHLTLPTIA